MDIAFYKNIPLKRIDNIIFHKIKSTSQTNRICRQTVNPNKHHIILNSKKDHNIVTENIPNLSNDCKKWLGSKLIICSLLNHKSRNPVIKLTVI